MAQASEYLIEIGANNGAGVITLRVSSCGFTTGPTDVPANTEYERRIIDPAYFDRSLFEPQRTMGASDVSVGTIVLNNVDGGLDGWVDYGFSGQPVTIKRIAGRRASFASAVVILRGTVEGLESSEALKTVKLRLRDRRRELDRALQVNRYTGTTTSGGLADNLANGTADMKDQPKPIIYGTVRNVRVIIVNPFDLIGQVNDGAVASVVVYDGGVPLTNAGDFATAALLQAADLRPGQYGTCLALGLVCLGGTPQYDVTADVVEGATLAERYAGAIAQRILARMGLTGSTNINAASVTALNAAAPIELSIYIEDDRTGLDALGAILSSVGGYILPNEAGVFEVGRFVGLGTPTWEISRAMIHGSDMALLLNTDCEGEIPAWRTILKYGRVWGAADQSRLGPFLSADRKAFLSTEWREAKAEAAATKTKHTLSPEISVETLIANAADATTEAARLLALHSVTRRVLMISVRRDDADAMPLNSTGTVTYPRLGFASGRLMVVIGRREDPASELVKLTLWG